jgi:hypothetical protein
MSDAERSYAQRQAEYARSHVAASPQVLLGLAQHTGSPGIMFDLQNGPGPGTAPTPTPTSAKSKGKKTPSVTLEFDGHADDTQTPTSAASSKRKGPKKAAKPKGKASNNKVGDGITCPVELTSVQEGG